MRKMIVPYDMWLDEEEVDVIKVKKECTLNDVILMVRNNDRLRRDLYLISIDNYVKNYKLNEGQSLNISRYSDERINNHYDYIFIEKEDYNIVLSYYNWRFSYIKYFIDENKEKKQIKNAYEFATKMGNVSLKCVETSGRCEAISSKKIKYSYTTLNPDILYEEYYRDMLKKYLDISMSNDSIKIKSISVTHDPKSFIPLLGHDGNNYYRVEVTIIFENITIDEIDKEDIIKYLIGDLDMKFIRQINDKPNILLLLKHEVQYYLYTIGLDKEKCIHHILVNNETGNFEELTGKKLVVSKNKPKA